MIDEHDVRRLRAAVFVRDGAAAAATLRDEVLTEVPQLAGDGLLLALDQRVSGAVELARACVARLRERDSDGDDELVAELEAALSTASLSLPRAIPVDLEELADALEGDPTLSGGRLDLQTGDVWPGETYDVAEVEEEDDDDRWLHIDSLGSGDAYRDMLDFTATIADAELAEKLEIALDGRGTFGRFKSVLARYAPDELERWYRYNGDRSRGRARAWLASLGYRPSLALRGPGST
jgi:hypothetical protein